MEESIKYRFTRKRALTTHTHCCWYFCTIARHQRHPVNTATPYWSEKWSMGRTKPQKRTKRNPRTLSRAVCEREAVVGHHHLRVCADSCVDGVSITRMNESSLRTVDLECSVKQNSFLIDFRCCMSRFWRRSSSLCKRWRRMQSRIEKEPQRRNWRKKSIACYETKTLKFNFWPRKVESRKTQEAFHALRLSMALSMEFFVVSWIFLTFSAFSCCQVFVQCLVTNSSEFCHRFT